MDWSPALFALGRSVLAGVGAAVLAVLVHESGHYLVARLMGRTASWGLDQNGPHVEHDGPDLTPWRQVAITLSGAAANLLAAVVLPGVWGLAQAGIAVWALLWPHPLSDGWRTAKVLVGRA